MRNSVVSGENNSLKRILESKDVGTDSTDLKLNGFGKFAKMFNLTNPAVHKEGSFIRLFHGRVSVPRDKTVYL